MSEWIDVDDMSKPEVGHQYLIAWTSRHGDSGMAVAQKTEGGWQISTPWCGAAAHEHLGRVTHWQKAPEPPK